MKRIILLTILFIFCVFGNVEARVVEREIAYHGRTLQVTLPTELASTVKHGAPYQEIHINYMLQILRFGLERKYVDLLLANITPEPGLNVVTIRAYIFGESFYYTHFVAIAGASAYRGLNRWVEVRKIPKDEFQGVMKWFCKDSPETCKSYKLIK